MSNPLKLFLLTGAILAGFTLKAMPAAVESKGVASPVPSTNAVAVINIPKPRERHLMHLAGMVGRGTILLQMPETQKCHKMDVRLIAGGFWGYGVSPQSKPVRMLVTDPQVIRDLTQGREVISDEVPVSLHATPRAGIRVLEGLPEHTGFVLNPGRGLAAEMFGPHLRAVPCRDLTAAYQRWVR